MSFDPNQSAQASAQDQQALDDVLSPERISAFESLSARSFEMMVLIIICVSLLLFALIVLYAYEVEEFAVSFVWLAGGIGAGIGLLMLLVIANAFPSPEASRLLTAVTNVIGAVAMNAGRAIPNISPGEGRRP
ncbi:MAG TPA: hypothetical protein VE963_18615 [Reyranella sp.]|nr:hypothetical protein [Reyranella sp.]